MGARRAVRGKQPQVYPLRYIEDFFAKHDEVAAPYRIPRQKLLRPVLVHHGAGGAFSGTAEDYVYGGLQFPAIVDRRGVAGLMRVYKVMREDELSFHDAILKALSWNRATLQGEMREVSARH